jgi:hypothetical protein
MAGLFSLGCGNNKLGIIIIGNLMTGFPLEDPSTALLWLCEHPLPQHHAVLTLFVAGRVKVLVCINILGLSALWKTIILINGANLATFTTFLELYFRDGDLALLMPLLDLEHAFPTVE